MTGSMDPAQASQPPDPAHGPSVPAVKDIDRRMKPSQFFAPLGGATDAASLATPIMLRLGDRYRQWVEDDIAAVRRRFLAADRAERLFPIRADTMAFGALEGFRPGDSIGLARIPRETPLLVIGDTHGDSWSLAAALRLALKPRLLHRLGVLPEAVPPAVVILGDLVDRGQDHVECALLALQRIKSHPHSTIWIAGNHDIGHSWSVEESRFVSELSPAEFADWLNEGEPWERARRIDFGKAFLEYVKDLPRAVAFRCGLLATHGGVPHCDIFHTFKSLEALKQSSAAKDDFTWVRVAEKAPVKYPNRSRRGCELGTEQLVASVAHMSELLERRGHPRIKAVVRGHDHHDDRYFVHRAGFPLMSLLTVNTMGVGDEGDSPFLSGDLQPCVAVYVPGCMPRVLKLVRPVTEPGAIESPVVEAASAGPETANPADPVGPTDRQPDGSSAQCAPPAM